MRRHCSDTAINSPSKPPNERLFNASQEKPYRPPSPAGSAMQLLQAARLSMRSSSDQFAGASRHVCDRKGGASARRLDAVSRETRVREAQMRFGPDLGYTGPKQRGYGPEMWAITLEQLEAITRERKYRKTKVDLYGHIFLGMTMHEIVSDIIKPMTVGTSVGYAILKNSPPVSARTFVSHAWDELYENFLAALGGSGERGPYWVCATSLYQAEDDKDLTILKQMGNCPSTGPAATVLKQANVLIGLVTPVNLSTRLWCLYEMFTASLLGVPVRFNQSITYSEDAGYEDIFTTHCANPVMSCASRCGPMSGPMNSDEAALRKHVEAIPGGFLAVDMAVELARLRAVRKLQLDVVKQASLSHLTDLVPARRIAHARRMCDSCHALVTSMKEQRLQTVHSMSKLAPSVCAAAFAAALGDLDADVRCIAAQCLSTLGEPAAEWSKGALAHALEDSSANVRHAAAVALGEMGELEPEYAEALANRLQDEDVRVRRAAATSLGHTAKAAVQFAQTLELALKDTDATVRCVVAESLGRSIGKHELARSLSGGQWERLI